LRYFRHHTGGVDMTWEGGEPVIGRVWTEELEQLLGPARRPDEPIEPRHEAIAASAQAIFEEAAFHVLRGVHRRTGQRRLALAGCRRRDIDELEDRAGWAAERVAQGQVVGWFQCRAEWGARALGNRSIVADPRRADMRDIINTKIKMRERFRPFAPSILEESLDDWFVGAVPDPFMVQVYPVRPDRQRGGGGK